MNILATQNAPAFDKTVEKAILYLVQASIKSGHNPKPFVLHSIRTGLVLYHQNCPLNVIVAAILHDVVEDTDVRIGEVENEFGSEVAQLVAANSFNPEIRKKEDRDIELLDRCKKGGRWALLIKATDILDNSAYFHLCMDEEQFDWLLEKTGYFLDISSGELAEEQVWQSLKQRHLELQNSSGISP